MPTPITEDHLRRIYAESMLPLYRFASRMCGGERDLAEDVVQEVWLRAMREWRRSGPPDRPLHWLRVVARNLIVSHFRKREGIPLDSVSAAEILAAVDEDRVSESVEIAALVARALLRIPEPEARLVEAFYYDQCKVAQLAESYGVSERAIEGRLRRAREHLRKEVTSLLSHPARNEVSRASGIPPARDPSLRSG
jgi:RNA polymerase sigma-70 factor (ECF subfamily)